MILAVEAPLSVTQGAGNTHNGSVVWSYDVADSNFDFIADGETLVLTYTAIQSMTTMAASSARR